MSSSNGDRKSPLPSLISASSAPHGLFGLTAPIKRAYVPRLPLNPRALSSIFIPFGHSHLFQGLDILGKALLADEWSGDEVIARSPQELLGPMLWAGVVKTRPEPDLLGVMLGGELVRGPYCAPTTTGLRYFKDREDAETVWASEQPRLHAMFEQEQLARKRFVEVRDALRKLLHAAHLTAHVFDPETGVIADITSAFWGSNAATKVFELRSVSDPLDRPLPQIQSAPGTIGGQFFPKLSGYLTLRNETLEHIARVPAEQEPLPATPTPVDPVPEQKPLATPPDVNKWAIAEIEGAQSNRVRLSQTVFEERAAAIRLKRDAARALWKEVAPLDWQARGRPRKMRQKKREK